METFWDLLSYPRLCGLLARKPTRLGQAMHNAGFAELGLPFAYVAFDTEDTAHALDTMRRLGFRGFSLTIPHKETALPLLDECSREASVIGAVNTVVNSGKSLFGENTDWIGVRDSLLEARVEVRGKDALMFGAGGAARAGIFALKEMGARRIVVCNRTPERANALALQFGVEAAPFESLAPQEFSLIINSTPLGSHLDAGPNPLELFYQRKAAALPAYFEMVTRDTPLLAKVRECGAPAVSGSRMLLYQALEQFRLFTGTPAPKAAMERALADELRR